MSRNAKAFPLRSRAKQGCNPSLFLLNIVLEMLTRTIRQVEEIKGIQIWKEEVKVYDRNLYIQNAKDSTKSY